MATFDLVIRGGTVVTPGMHAFADIGIAGGRITAMGTGLQGAQQIDAVGMLVLPGGVDAHVHLSRPPGEPAAPAWVDDFTSGSAAALAGGITTVGNMTFPGPDEPPRVALAREEAVARAQCIADVFLHPVLEAVTPQTLEEIPGLPEVGCTSLKIFMVSPGFDAQVQDYVQAIRLAGASGLLTLLHCEDHALIQDATAHLMRRGRTHVRHYDEACPVVSEVVAVQRAVAIAEATGAPIYIVHLSSARALAACAEAQARGLPVFVETRPLYLHLTRERLQEVEGAKYIGQPPLREQHDADALWAGLQQGTVHTVCSDHAPWALAAKLDPALTMAAPRPGVENLQFLWPLLYSEGVRGGRLSLHRFVEVTATNAAKLCGLYPRKGTLAVGSDADLVVFDPTLRRMVERSMLKSNADYSVYEGWEVTGWPVVTVRRGEIVFQEGQVRGAAGSGQVLRREPTERL